MEVAETRQRARQLPWKWIAIGAAVIVLIFAARLLPVVEWLRYFNSWVSDLGPAGLALFVAAYALAAVLFVPGSVLTIGAGFAFGVLWGSIVVSIGATLGAAFAFLIARHIARGKVEQKIRGNQKLKRIDRAIGERGAKLIFLLRLNPLIPFNFSNYFYGLTAVRFWPYVFASWAGMTPGTILYVYLGAAGKAGLQAAASGQTGRSPLEWALFGVGLVATVVVTIIVTRVARNALKENVE